LSTTSLPETVLAAAVVEPVEVPEEDLDELPPQAVASMHAAASDNSHVERFIDILLRSRSTIASWPPGQKRLCLRPRPTFGKYLNKRTISAEVPLFNYEKDWSLVFQI
jgi:hypothetical protein